DRIVPAIAPLPGRARTSRGARLLPEAPSAAPEGAFLSGEAVCAPAGRAPKKRAMAEISTLFVTKLYRARLEEAGALNRELAAACRSIAREDAAGRRWSREHGYAGYTSYASLDDLPKRDPSFAALKKALDKHAGAFARALHL